MQPCCNKFFATSYCNHRFAHRFGLCNLIAPNRGDRSTAIFEAERGSYRAVKNLVTSRFTSKTGELLFTHPLLMKFTHRHFDWLLYSLAWPEFREKLLQGDMRLRPEATYSTVCRHCRLMRKYLNVYYYVYNFVYN